MANEFGTNLRMSQTLPILYDIEDDFKLKLSKQATQLKIAISIVFALAIIAFVLLFISYFKRKKLINTRKKLRVSNSNLDKLNKELHAENSKLDMMNNELLETKEALSDTNIKLSENNRIKEEYIGRFLSLCSLYVEKNKSLKNNALKMLKARQFAELQERLKNTKQDEKELEDLYKYFDEAFIHLFPTFVKHFNLLLREGERIYPPTGRLNTQIRIFALIRLGVEDSSRIAEFLNYSPNTIYNYRAKVKNGAIERDSFEDEVKNHN